MTLRRLFPFLLLVLLAALFLSVPSASADSSHARIIRLSVVTGDVRFAAKTQGDPLTDSRAGWDAAQMNLPIRQGYVLATDNGRTEVEFENGTLAFLKDRKSTRLNSSHSQISYAVFCLKKKKQNFI